MRKWEGPELHPLDKKGPIQADIVEIDVSGGGVRYMIALSSAGSSSLRGAERTLAAGAAL